MPNKTRGRPKKVIMSEDHRKELTKGVDLMIVSMQQSEHRGYDNGYGDGLVRGYKEGFIAGRNVERSISGKSDNFNFWVTLFSTIFIGSVLILLWWALSGQTPPWKS